MLPALVAQPASLTYQSDPSKADAVDGDIGRKRRLFTAWEDNKRREIEEQREARRYYSGRQWTDAEIAILNKRNQPVIWDNRIARKVDFLVGVEQRMRRDPKAYARNPNDQGSADVATAALRFTCDHSRWETIASDAANDGMVSGVGVAWIGIENGPRGLDPKIKRGQVDRFFYDPRSTLPDFSDARYMGMHLWVDKEDLKAEYPDRADAIEDMFDSATGVSTIDQDRAEQWADFERERVRVIELYERKPMPTMGGFGWYFCKFTGGTALESMWSPYVDEYGVPDCPYVAWSPYIDERGDRYGVVRNMRPMQDEVNQRRSKLLHLVNVKQIHTRKGVIEDVDDTRQQLSKPDGVIEHTGTWGQDIGIVENEVEVRGQAELLAQAQSSLENLGPNPGLIGKGGGVADQSGRAILAQRDSGMTELSPVFERLRDWKLRCYRKMWARIKQSWTGERYIRITDDPKAPSYLGVNQYAMDPLTGMVSARNVIGEIDVDIILDEGPDTIVMQEELMQTLSQLGEAAMGPLGRVMIELSQVSNKDQLLQIMDKAVAPDPAVAQMQQRMAKLEEMLAAINIDKARAEVENKRADTFSKLMTAATPPQPQQTDAFGNPIGPPPAAPDLAGAMAAMRMFPLQFGSPLLEEQAERMPTGQPEPQQSEGGEPPSAPSPMMPDQGAMPPIESMMSPEMGSATSAGPING